MRISFTKAGVSQQPKPGSRLRGTYRRGALRGGLSADSLSLSLGMNKYKEDKDKIYEVVKGKLFDGMKKRELYFVMGTHYVYGTWLNISLIYPKKLLEKTLKEF